MGTTAGDSGWTPESETVRQQHFEVNGTPELDIAIGAGRVEVRLSDQPGVHVEVRHASEEASPFSVGLSGLVTWVTHQFTGTQSQSAADEAVRRTRIDLVGQRVAVHAPRGLPLRTVPLSITVHAPGNTEVAVHGDTADITVNGTAGRLDVDSGTGDVTVDRVEGKASVHSGSGTVRLGTTLGGLRLRTGIGNVEIASVGGPSTLLTGSGDVWLGTVQSDTTVRSGTGDVTVADAASGRIELQTGSGEVRVGIRSGVTAQIDLFSATGRARSELEVKDEPPAEEPTLWVRARSAAGDVVVTRAVN